MPARAEPAQKNGDFMSHIEATSSQLNQMQVLAAFASFINQRPGLDFADYGNVSAWRQDSAQITRDRKRALAALYAAEIAPWDAVAMKAAFGAFSGRLTPVIREDGKLGLDYCTGQYWPTEMSERNWSGASPNPEQHKHRRLCGLALHHRKLRIRCSYVQQKNNNRPPGRVDSKPWDLRKRIGSVPQMRQPAMC
jgi:hypothetical protein